MKIKAAFVLGSACALAGLHVARGQTAAQVQDCRMGDQPVVWSQAHAALPLLAMGAGSWDTYREIESGPAARGGTGGSFGQAPGQGGNHLLIPGSTLDATSFPETQTMAHLLEAFGEAREVPRGTGMAFMAAPAGASSLTLVLAAPHLPANVRWIQDRLQVADNRVLLHVTAWEAAGEPGPRQRVAYTSVLTTAAMPAAGASAVALTVDHFKQGADGYYHATGERQTANLPFVYKPGVSPQFPRAAAPGAAAVLVDAALQAALFEKDLKTEQGAAMPLSVLVPPRRWKGTVAVPAPISGWHLSVGRLAHGLGPSNGQGQLTTMPELAALAPLEAAPAGELYALLLAPSEKTIASRDGLELEAVSLEPGACTLRVGLWEAPAVGGISGPMPQDRASFCLVPLEFLAPGLHHLAVSFAYRSSSAHTGEEVVVGDSPPAVPVDVKRPG